MLNNTASAQLLINLDIVMLKIESLGLLIVFAAAGSCCCADPLEAHAQKLQNLASDLELIEFLAEFEEMDDEEFELLISYAKKDSEQDSKEGEVQQND
ncbi:MAG: hypothetical protein AB8B81_07800 [Halioglobus sp.]